MNLLIIRISLKYRFGCTRLFAILQFAKWPLKSGACTSVICSNVANVQFCYSLFAGELYCKIMFILSDLNCNVYNAVGFQLGYFF